MDGRVRLAWNVRRLRTARGLTQEKLAIDASVAAPYVSRIEQAKGNPSIDVLSRLAGALGVAVDDLLREPEAGGTPPEPLRAGRKRKKVDKAVVGSPAPPSTEGAV